MASFNSLRPSDAYMRQETNQVIIGSDNGLSPGRRQAIIWNNAGLLLIEPLGTNISEISIGIQTFSFKKMHLNMSSVKWRPFCLGLNMIMVLRSWQTSMQSNGNRACSVRSTYISTLRGDAIHWKRDTEIHMELFIQMGIYDKGLVQNHCKIHNMRTLNFWYAWLDYVTVLVVGDMVSNSARPSACWPWCDYTCIGQG